MKNRKTTRTRLQQHGPAISNIQCACSDFDPQKEGKTSKFELHTYWQVPPGCRYEHILTGYRRYFSFKLCLQSIFRIHNETGNIWTHLGGILFFSVLAWHVFNTQLVGANAITRGLYAIYLSGTMVTLCCSVLYHTFHCHSKHIFKTTATLDYCGIGVLVSASFYPPVYFGFHCIPNWMMFYTIMFSSIGLASIIVPFFPIFSTGKYAGIRMGLNIFHGASGVLVMVHAYVLFPSGHMSGGGYFGLMYLFYGGGVVLYLLHIPERFYPGNFDYFFNSHQIWHLCVCSAAYCQFEAINCIYENYLITPCHQFVPYHNEQLTKLLNFSL